MKTAFTNATILPIEGDIIEGGILIIDNGKITDIGNSVSVDGCEIIDCSGKFIVPGFIDAHSHVSLWPEGVSAYPAGGDGNERMEAVNSHLRTLDAIWPEDIGMDDARRGGVTTMGLTHGSANPIGAQFAVVKSYGNNVEKMLIRAPAGIKFAMGENPKRVGFEQKRLPSTRMSTAYVIRDAFYQALDYREEWEHYEKSQEIEQGKDESERKSMRKPKINLTYEALLMLIDNKIPVMSHAHRADDIITAIRLSEEFGYKLVIHHATESYKVKDVIVEKGIPVVVGPLFGTRVKHELKDQKVSTPGVMMKAGALVCITTDAPVIPINGLLDTVIMAVREGLPSERALETITINPAKVLGVDNRTGSLKVGKDADFLIFNGDPLDARNKLEKTYIDGNLVYELTELL
ncbi:MAG: amidohydrolase [Candidatus Heimdallarchaeota archaeon]|nr:amidohydrolase [Candidatus Heimdallarchaeota archaeon]